MRPEDLVALDRAATRALLACKDKARAQLAALDALDALADACDALHPGGALMHMVRDTRRLRAKDFGAVHRFDVEEATRAFALEGARAQEALVSALEECVTFLRATEGVTGEVRTLELQLEDARRGKGGAPRPFFARFLEDGQPRRGRSQ